MFKSASVSVSAALLSFALVACGGGGNIGTPADGGGTPPTTPTPTPPTTPAPATPVLRMGTLNGSTFTPNVIQITSANVSAGGSTGLKVDIVDTANNNQLVADQAITVNFSSPCASSSQSTITSPVVTATGTATSTYAAQGCSGTDAITATASIGTQNLVASGTVNVAPAPVASIQFASVSVASIRIRGTGDPQTAIVRFTVRNSAGGPVQNQAVRFSLDTTAGGITLSPASGITDSTGSVQTTVASGTVPTSVRITATVLDSAGAAVPGIPPAQSDSLTISTGLADQNSFSISAGCFNIEGGDYNGVQTSISVFAADRFNNPVPDNTAISFRSEGGQVQPQCLTTGGNCSVMFTSSEPRTADHRVTVLATAIGEESFVDTDGNGQYNTGESFADLPEAFLDRNENNIRDSNEEFVDFNNNSAFNAPSGNFTGVLCASGCDTATSLSVRASLPIILSGSTASTLDIAPNVIDLSAGGTVQVIVTVADSANQPMPAGTEVAVTTSLGSITGEARRLVPCTTTNGPTAYAFFVRAPEPTAPADRGVFTVNVTTPGVTIGGTDVAGVVTSRSVSVIFDPGSGGTTQPPPAPLGSILFVSANPTVIGIRGTGQDETAQVSFLVQDQNGNPIPNQAVSFTTTTTAGGLTVTPNGVTDASGRVVATVQSGTVQTSVRITATATQGSLTRSAQSSQLVITTGIPDQDSFSFSTERLNSESFNVDGVNTVLTIRLADRFNNPVPDGTAVAFTSECGLVEDSCLTGEVVSSSCPITLTSQNPRSSNGRCTVLAHALGEESFTDTNGNGLFDSGEPFQDVGEAFRDDNNSGVFELQEIFIDRNNNGVRDAPSGNFTGVLCNSGCDTARQINVFSNITVISSTSEADITPNVASLNFPSAESRQFTVNVQDLNGNAMAPGATIAATSTYGTVTDNGGVSPAIYTQLDTTAPGGSQNYTFIVNGGGTPGNGTIFITVTSSRGVRTSISFPVTGT